MTWNSLPRHLCDFVCTISVFEDILLFRVLQCNVCTALGSFLVLINYINSRIADLLTNFFTYKVFNKVLPFGARK